MVDDLDPRIARTRAVVLDAATHILAEEGHEGFTVDAVVARSGVAKTTIYRHWPTKIDLLIDAVKCFHEDMPTPDTGTFLAAPVALLTHLPHAPADLAGAAWSRSMPGLIQRAEHDPDLARQHAAVVRAKSSALREV